MGVWSDLTDRVFPRPDPQPLHRIYPSDVISPTPDSLPSGAYGRSGGHTYACTKNINHRDHFGAGVTPRPVHIPESGHTHACTWNAYNLHHFLAGVGSFPVTLPASGYVYHPTLLPTPFLPVRPRSTPTVTRGPDSDFPFDLRKTGPLPQPHPSRVVWSHPCLYEDVQRTPELPERRVEETREHTKEWSHPCLHREVRYRTGIHRPSPTLLVGHPRVGGGRWSTCPRGGGNRVLRVQTEIGWGRDPSPTFSGETGRRERSSSTSVWSCTRTFL